MGKHKLKFTEKKHKSMSSIEKKHRFPISPPKVELGYPSPDGGSYSVTIVSSAGIYSVDDPVWGKRYYFGNPKITNQEKTVPNRKGWRVKGSS